MDYIFHHATASRKSPGVQNIALTLRSSGWSQLKTSTLTNIIIYILQGCFAVVCCHTQIGNQIEFRIAVRGWEPNKFPGGNPATNWDSGSVVGTHYRRVIFHRTNPKVNGIQAAHICLELTTLLQS
jgi:hypothetical protein